MANLTPAETDRIIQTHLDSTGATATSLMSAWHVIVFQILERLELGAYHTDCSKLARDIVRLWSAVQPAVTYPPNHQFLFLSGEVQEIRNTFGELNRLALKVLLAHPTLPPRSRREDEKAMEQINEIAGYVRERIQLLDETEACNDGTAAVYATAGEMLAVLNRCMTLLAIVLGPEHTATFKTQYDACIGVWDHAIRMTQSGTKGMLH